MMAQPIFDQQTGHRYWLVGERVFHERDPQCQGKSISLEAFEAGREPPAPTTPPPLPLKAASAARPSPQARLAAMSDTQRRHTALQALLAASTPIPDMGALILAEQQRRGQR